MQGQGLNRSVLYWQDWFRSQHRTALCYHDNWCSLFRNRPHVIWLALSHTSFHILSLSVSWLCHSLNPHFLNHPSSGTPLLIHDPTCTHITQATFSFFFLPNQLFFPRPNTLCSLISNLLISTTFPTRNFHSFPFPVWFLCFPVFFFGGGMVYTLFSLMVGSIWTKFGWNTFC